MNGPWNVRFFGLYFSKLTCNNKFVDETVFFSEEVINFAVGGQISRKLVLNLKVLYAAADNTYFE